MSAKLFASLGAKRLVRSDGWIYADIDDPDTLLWSFSASGTNTYLIQNAATNRYMHAYPNNGTGVTTSGAYTSTLIQSGSGVKIRSNSEYAQLNEDARIFEMTQIQTDAATYSFAMTSRCTIWLDGTDGGLGHLMGSPDVAYTVQTGSTFRLPETWTSPSKYSFTLRGWYDVTNSRYYPPGSDVTITGNAVFYADWVATTYDIGQFNAQVAETVSTNSFITTHMFDYNYLFNVHSANPQGSVTASGHSETWSMVTSGAVNFGNRETFDFVFIDNDSGGRLCIPNNRSSHNVYPGAGIVTPDIYSAELGELLFATDNLYDPATGSGVLGKIYLGTGDHLFQIMDDPTDEHYGYYYFDSARNAASYSQSRERFYVYEYLSATSDAIGSTNSDFLPLNSPYANTNGKTVGSYNYNGVDGEYAGIPHYRYDSKYNSGNYNSVNNVHTNYAYGMRSDIKFYLPNDPGSGGNKDLYGNDIVFEFSGDDDLWVLIDGQVVLDIGGIHGAEDGVIDFSTGIVTVQGRQQTSLMDLGIGAGDHTLSVCYLERGSSLSNCSIYFNLAPRFGLQIRKEDVLTQETLNGAQFTVYADSECTEPVDLWPSEAAYNQDLADGILDQAQSTFTVADGVTSLWGLGSGNTYYIKETGPPSAEGYGLAGGVIRLTLGKDGVNTYLVDVIAEADGTEPSNGFTVHGVRIDEETKTMYLIVTNAPETVLETTTVQVLKQWEDTKDHSSDYVLAYLTVTDPDGTVRRIREVTLSDENDWSYIWTNLPKYDYEALAKVTYGIEESYESGYYSTVRKITEIQITESE
ncbi:MAG: Cna B-type domain-containing protein [Ruminococcaceae bacterium]|nr:Cna B-type domain-containing protein [Oscillospiraceae bacterium]